MNNDVPKNIPQNPPTLTGRNGLYAMDNKSNITLRQTQKLIDSLDVIYGFDLAQLILLISKNKISGHLNIISDKNEIYGVSFSDGSIIQIDNRDTKTFIGQLLIDEGYLTSDELKEHLKNKKNRIGAELIQSKKITKDQLIKILLKQIILRMSQLINSKSIKVSFANAVVDTSDVSIPYQDLSELAYGWVSACFTTQWLNMHYFEQKNNILTLNSDLIRNNYTEIYAQITELVGKDVIEVFLQKNKIHLLESEIKPELLYKIIHFFVLIDAVNIQVPEKNLIQEHDVQLFFSQFQKMSPEQKLNSLAMFTNSSVNETEHIYEKLTEKVKNLKIDVDLKNNVLKMSMNFLLNPETIRQAKSTNTESEIALATIKNDAKKLIYEQKYFEAFSLLKKLDETQMKSPRAELYATWCLIGHAVSSDIKIDLNALKIRLAKIRPEDRYEADYFYVMALYSKYTGQTNAAKQYYNKSCQMNPQFKELKISEDTLMSKIKSFFKFSVFLLCLTISQKIYSDPVSLPIKFTNQYYEYEVKENMIHIAGLDIETTQLTEKITELGLIKEKDSICYSKKTENAKLKICPVERNQSELKVHITNTAAPNTGTVILQDLREYVDFKVLQDKVVVLQFQTRRRPIAPYKIQKSASENKTHFTFLDLNNRKNIWTADLVLNELTFKLESVNEPYRILQDYVYVSQTPENDSINFTMKLPTEVQFSYHRFGLNALAGFSSFTTDTSTFKSRLNSAIGSGFKLLYEYTLDEATSLYTNLILYSATVSNEQTNIIVTNKKFSIFDFNLGYKVYYDLNWAISYEFNYRNYFTTKETSLGSTNFLIDQSNSYSIGLSPEYTFLESRRWNMVMEISPSLILPQKTAYGQTQVGFGLDFGAKTTYKLKSTRVYAGINYDDRTFNSADAKYKNKNFIYSVGFYYLF